jgi:hypothetical protein
MAFASAPSLGRDFCAALDELLSGVCEELQLPPSRYDEAVERYEAVGDLLESEGSPFCSYHPKIYPQGSMRLGTTVKPIEGPHDLDFVCELSLGHEFVDPMRLLRSLYAFLRGNGTYRSMTSLMNRCVRVEYANEFYMDILPACRNGFTNGTCIKVPDREVKGWKDSDPLGYATWFERRSRILFLEQLLEKAEPVPERQTAREKKPLQLAVQLMKRRRDLYFKDSDLATVSVVLTTLAADVYGGQTSVSHAISSILAGIITRMETAQESGNRLRVPNPANPNEDLSERWNQNQPAYRAFGSFIRDFQVRWSRLLATERNVNAELEELFGEPVKTVLKKQAKKLQEDRLASRLGVSGTGLITVATSARVPIPQNTFHGAN